MRCGMHASDGYYPVTPRFFPEQYYYLSIKIGLLVKKQLKILFLLFFNRTTFFSCHEKKVAKKNHRRREKSENELISLKHKTPPFTAAGCNVRQTTCVS